MYSNGAHYLLNFRLQNYFLELAYYASVIFEMTPAIMWRANLTTPVIKFSQWVRIKSHR